jgi:peptide chain release factor 1
MIPAETLSRVTDRFAELTHLLAQPTVVPAQFTKLSKEYAELEPVAKAIAVWQGAQQERRELEALRQDPEMKTLAEAELQALRDRVPQLEQAMLRLLLPKDEADARNAILEIRAGAGGEEAALFAARLFAMYRRYAAVHGWGFEVLALAESDIGGLKEGVASINGHGVFARLKFESGVHRVQRVPQTEAAGRVHTSTATVAVLPEAEEVDIHIDEKDLHIDVYRASGAGGQHVNKTESAVRITHAPSGIVVACQDERSQHKNRARAMTMLRAKLYDQERTAKDSVRAADRKGQVGTGDRSERIRTYNFPQGRVSDHRVELTLYKIDPIIAGDALDEIIDVLLAHDEAERLTRFIGL